MLLLVNNLGGLEGLEMSSRGGGVRISDRRGVRVSGGDGVGTTDGVRAAKDNEGLGALWRGPVGVRRGRYRVVEIRREDGDEDGDGISLSLVRTGGSTKDVCNPYGLSSSRWRELGTLRVSSRTIEPKRLHALSVGME